MTMRMENNTTTNLPLPFCGKIRNKIISRYTLINVNDIRPSLRGPHWLACIVCGRIVLTGLRSRKRRALSGRKRWSIFAPAAWCQCCLMSVLFDVGAAWCRWGGKICQLVLSLWRFRAKERNVERSVKKSGDEGDCGGCAEVIVTERTEVIGKEKERRKERWKEQWQKRVEVIETKVRKANVAKPDEGENEPLKLQKTAAETPFSFLGCFKQKRRRICNVSQWNGTYFKGLLCCKPLIFRRDINLFVGRRGGGGAHGGSRGCYVVSPKFP
jgi:hypothetical protein